MLTPYVRAAFPAVAVETHEEDRFMRDVMTGFPTRQCYSIAATGGLFALTLADGGRLTRKAEDPAMNYGKAFPWLAEAGRAASFLFVLDFHHVARNAIAYRALKDNLSGLRASGCMVILMAPHWTMPIELQHDVPVLRYDLPSREDQRHSLGVVVRSITTLVDAAGKTMPDTSEDTVSALLDAAAGLTLQEAEGAFALSFSRDGFNPDRVVEEKMKLVRQSGYLEFNLPASPESIGGLAGVKRYATDEVLPAQSDPELAVKGILLVGVQGCGKSLISKGFGAWLNWPVLRLDVGALMGGVVGESEGNMRSALRLVDAVAPCVLWIDEIEKAVGGHASSAKSDGGTLLRMVGQLLTWMQEHTSRVFTVATCNDFSKLPPELTRAGRFNERFFVDLPTLSERVEIARIHLLRVKASPEFDAFIAGLTEGFSGAEIEDVVLSSARRSRRNLSEEVIHAVIGDARPLSRVAAAEISALRKWAGETLRPASEGAPATSAATAVGRKMSMEDFE